MNSIKDIEFLAWDKQDEVLFKVGTINLPLGSPSWKDMSVDEGGGWAWRGIDEVILLRYTGDKNVSGEKLYEVINYSKEHVFCQKGGLISLPDNILVTQNVSNYFKKENKSKQIQNG